MSITYSAVATIVRLLNIKKLFRMPRKRIIASATKQCNKFKLDLNRFKGYNCSIEEAGGFPYIKLQAGLKPATKAVLQLYGGGYMTPPDSRDFKLAKRIVDQTGSNVWLFLYPLAIEHRLDVTFEQCYKLYRRMLKCYAAKEISTLGFSSGACLATGLGLHNSVQSEPLPMPRQIIAVSPGACPLSLCEGYKATASDADLIASLEKLSAEDIITDYHHVSTITPILSKGQKLPAYMLNNCTGDFSYFPKTCLYYGSCECSYACAPYFKEAFVRYGVPYGIHVGGGSCHCYPLFRFFPEGRRIQDGIIDRLK